MPVLGPLAADIARTGGRSGVGAVIRSPAHPVSINANNRAMILIRTIYPNYLLPVGDFFAGRCKSRSRTTRRSRCGRDGEQYFDHVAAHATRRAGPSRLSIEPAYPPLTATKGGAVIWLA
jgi:hypothetical protein